MPEETKVDQNAENPEATATPEAEPRLSDEQKEALVAAGIPADELDSYLQDKSNLVKHYNRRYMELSGSGNGGGNDKLAESIAAQNKLIADTVEQFKPKPKAERFIPEKLFQETFGVRDDADLDREATLRDIYRVGEYVGTQAITRFEKLFGDVPRKEDGTPMTAAEMMRKIEEIDQKATVSHEAVTGQLVDQVKGAVGTKFPRARKGLVDDAIKQAQSQGLRGAEFRDFVIEQAKADHDYYQEVAQQAADAERRRLIPTPDYTGSGSGATPAGEKRLNPWNKADRDRLDTRTG